MAFDFAGNTAMNEAKELYPDSLEINNIMMSSKSSEQFDDTVEITIFGEDTKNKRKIELFRVDMLKEDIGEDFFLELNNGLKEAKKEENLMKALSEYWREHLREEHVLKQKIKDGAVLTDKDGNLKGKDKEAFENISAWKKSFSGYAKDELQSKIFYPTGRLVVADCVSFPVPKGMTKDEYRLACEKAKLEMARAGELDIKNGPFKVRNPKLDNSLKQYYEYIHSTDRALRRQCIEDLRANMKNAMGKFLRGRDDMESKAKKTFEMSRYKNNFNRNYNYNKNRNRRREQKENFRNNNYNERTR